LLQCWRASSTLQYALQGHPWDLETVALITRLVNARAVPGSGCFFDCSDRDDREVLDHFDVLGFARMLSDEAAFSTWALTDRAMTLLRPCRELLHPSPALADRGLPLAQRTNYEILVALQSDGWTWEKAPKRFDIVPYEVGVSPKIWYSKGADLPREYAMCLLCSADLQLARSDAGEELVRS
jgi:hypothetical protein